MVTWHVLIYLNQMQAKKIILRLWLIRLMLSLSIKNQSQNHTNTALAPSHQNHHSLMLAFFNFSNNLCKEIVKQLPFYEQVELFMTLEISTPDYHRQKQCMTTKYVRRLLYINIKLEICPEMLKLSIIGIRYL